MCKEKIPQEKKAAIRKIVENGFWTIHAKTLLGRNIKPLPEICDKILEDLYIFLEESNA